jgi:hypothetical protein
LLGEQQKMQDMSSGLAYWENQVEGGGEVVAFTLSSLIADWCEFHPPTL